MGKNLKMKNKKTQYKNKIKVHKKTRKIKKLRKIKYDNDNIDKNVYDKFKKMNCSPKLEQKSYTCYSDENLHKMRDIWNARYPDHSIKTNDPHSIWISLKKFYSRICNKESCWITQMAKGTPMEKELLNSFAPQSPKEWKKNPNEWLTSVDIIEVMNQYEKTYKCFEFLGPSPIDYDKYVQGECVWEELCHFNLLQQIKKGKTKIGIIFNTDPHNKGGEHWISLFINIKKAQIYFFDSVGNKIPYQIEKFVKDLMKQGKQMSPPIYFQFDQNYPVEHQYKNTECGIYSIFFIVHMLQDKITGNYLKTHILKDEYIQNFRKIYYNDDL